MLFLLNSDYDILKKTLKMKSHVTYWFRIRKKERQKQMYVEIIFTQ